MKPLCRTLLISSLMWPCLTHAATYQWVDENGVTHFSQTAPSQPNYKIIPSKQRYQSNATAQPTAKTDSSPSQSPPPTEKPNVSAASEMTATKEECDQIKLDLEKLRSIARIRLQEGDSTKVLTEEEKQAMINERENWLSTLCK